MMTCQLLFLTLTAIAAGSTQATVGPARTLLDSLGSAPRTTLIREYELEAGGLGRQYATDLPLDQAPTTVTVFYRDKLLAQGWQTLEEHAAVSAYAKGDITVAILRAGPTDPGLPPKARLLRSAALPANAKFFFAIEAGQRQ
jgi:hypothetical protein